MKDMIDNLNLQSLLEENNWLQVLLNRQKIVFKLLVVIRFIFVMMKLKLLIHQSHKEIVHYLL